jgi:hypothetical protein
MLISMYCLDQWGLDCENNTKPRRSSMEIFLDKRAKMWYNRYMGNTLNSVSKEAYVKRGHVDGVDVAVNHAHSSLSLLRG